MKRTKCFLAAFMTAIMLVAGISLSACGSENELGLREQKDNGMIALDVWGNTMAYSTTQINRITLSGEDGSEFVCSTKSDLLEKEGRFLSNTQSGDTSLTVANGSTVFWAYRYYDENGMQIAQNDRIWLEFINRKDSRILGYAVVRVDKIANYHYEANVVKSVTFPQVNGMYQTVTEDQVHQLMNHLEKN